MNKFTALLCISSFFIAVISSIAKNKLCMSNFVQSFPMFLISVVALIVSSFCAQKYRAPNAALSFVVFLGVAWGFLLWYSIKHVPIMIISLFAPCKLIFTCVIAKFRKKLDLNKIQYFSIFLISIGSVIPLFANIKRKQKSFEFLHAFLYILSTFFFGAANVAWEEYKNKYDPLFADMVFSGSLIAVPLSICILFLEMVKSKATVKGLFEQENLGLILAAALVEAICKMYICQMVNPVYRSFIVLTHSMFVGVLGALIFRDEFLSRIVVLSFLITNFGILIYDLKAIKGFLLKEKENSTKEDSILKSEKFNDESRIKTER